MESACSTWCRHRHFVPGGYLRLRLHERGSGLRSFLLAVFSGFVGCMSMLVLANNLVILYAFWEGVGLCSYLLIVSGITDRRPQKRHSRPFW